MSKQPAAKHIAILFEYGTLNGGERSMLAVLEQLYSHQSVRFTAVLPGQGDLIGSVAGIGIPTVVHNMRDDSDRKRPHDAIEAELSEILGRLSADLIHANSLSMGVLLGRLGNRVQGERRCHIRDIYRLSNSSVRHLNRLDGIAAVSEATRQFHTQQGVRLQTMRVLYNGVDCREFRPRPKTHQLAFDLGLSERSVLALTVGQIGLRKGQDLLPRLAHRLAAEHLELHFVVAGERYSGKAESIEFEAALSGEFDRCGLADRLHLLGYRSNVAYLMNESDLLIHPAKQEPFGRVLLEAAATGLPIVATDVGGTGELLAHDTSALLVRPGNVADCAGAVLRIVREKQLAERLGCAARACVARDFTSTLAARRTLDFWLD